MNRRDLFKRAGKVAAGLGLAAVVPQIPEPADEFDDGWISYDEVRALEDWPRLTEHDPSSITLTIDHSKFSAYEFDGSQTLKIDSWTYYPVENTALPDWYVSETLPRLRREGLA